MKVAVLFSGGKDSNFALYKASLKHEVVCLISMISQNSQSYMFQTPGNKFIKKQAEAMQIPLIEFVTKGKKEEELEDLKKAIIKAVGKFEIQGVVSGAIKSVYQASRIQKICNELDIYSFNPLWQIDEKVFLKELIAMGFKVIIIGIASYPFDEKFLGKVINEKFINQMTKLGKTYSLSLAGEGGEFESFVIDSPLFLQKLKIKKSEKIMDSKNSGVLIFKKIVLEKK